MTQLFSRLLTDLTPSQIGGIVGGVIGGIVVIVAVVLLVVFKDKIFGKKKPERSESIREAQKEAPKIEKETAKAEKAEVEPKKEPEHQVPEKHVPTKEEIAKEEKKTVEEKKADAEKAIHILFGGKDNILSIVQRGSRVTVNVKTTQGLKAEDFDKVGLTGAMLMSDKIVFFAGADAPALAANLKKEIGLE